MDKVPRRTPGLGEAVASEDSEESISVQVYVKWKIDIKKVCP